MAQAFSPVAVAIMPALGVLGAESLRHQVFRGHLPRPGYSAWPNLASAVLTQMLSSPSETISVPPVETDLGRQKGKR